jgi:hypothetical protein
MGRRHGETEDEYRQRKAEKKKFKAAEEADNAKLYFGFSNGAPSRRIRESQCPPIALICSPVMCLSSRYARPIFFAPESNPYNDPNLTSVFKWGKKIDQLRAKGDATADLLESKKYLKELRKQRHSEIVSVKARREQRESEKEQMEQMREQMERDAMLADEDEYQRKEEEFFLQQAVEKGRIRIEAGRERPIDILGKNLHIFHAAEAPEPNISLGSSCCLVLTGLSFESLL